MLFALLFIVSVWGQTWDPAHHLATKTPYYPPSSPPPPLPGNCAVSYVQLLVRHGARNPTEGDVKDLFALQDAVAANSGSINATEYGWMLAWKSPYTIATQGLSTNTTISLARAQNPLPKSQLHPFHFGRPSCHILKHTLAWVFMKIINFCHF